MRLKIGAVIEVAENLAFMRDYRELKNRADYSEEKRAIERITAFGDAARNYSMKVCELERCLAH